MTIEYEQAYEKIQAIVKDKPELGSVVASKLSSLADELQEDGATDHESTNGIADKFSDLKVGFHGFKKGFCEKHADLHNKLKTGQWPTYMVIACADSRVCPTAVLGFKPGDAFIIRNVANMVPAWEKSGYPSIGAALEYAVIHLKVKHILVVGHSGCGGVGALVKMTPEDGDYKTDFIERWVEIGKPARADVKSKLGSDASVEDICKTCETESVNNSLNNLSTYPFVVDAVSQGKVSLHGGYYNFLEGTFKTWDHEVKH